MRSSGPHRPGRAGQGEGGQRQVVILDVMLPGMDGFEVLKQLRRSSDIPVLMLTSRGEEADRIVGLEIGADDYLPKTFSTRELLARLARGHAAGHARGQPVLHPRANRKSWWASCGSTPPRAWPCWMINR